MEIWVLCRRFWNHSLELSFHERIFNQLIIFCLTLKCVTNIYHCLSWSQNIFSRRKYCSVTESFNIVAINSVLVFAFNVETGQIYQFEIASLQTFRHHKLSFNSVNNCKSSSSGHRQNLTTFTWENRSEVT